MGSLGSSAHISEGNIFLTLLLLSRLMELLTVVSIKHFQKKWTLSDSVMIVQILSLMTLSCTENCAVFREEEREKDEVKGRELNQILASGLLSCSGGGIGAGRGRRERETTHTELYIYNKRQRHTGRTF